MIKRDNMHYVSVKLGGLLSFAKEINCRLYIAKPSLSGHLTNWLSRAQTEHLLACVMCVSCVLRNATVLLIYPTPKY